MSARRSPHNDVTAPGAASPVSFSFGDSTDAMSFFDRFRKHCGMTSSESVDASLRQKLVELVLGLLQDKDGRVRVEDAISAAALMRLAINRLRLPGPWPGSFVVKS
jgi:hypothetical protein